MSLNIQNIFADKQTDLSGFVYGIVYTPKKNRNRFPDGIVTLVETEQELFELADPINNQHPAKLAGPARSSEGAMLYYLIDWL